MAIKIAYLGRGYSGSQYQPGLRTVVGDIYSDLESITREKDRKWFDLKVASRTDAGVNALDNVIVFNTEFDDTFALLEALNGVSERIFYKSVTEVDKEFNPRFADLRKYTYNLSSEGVDLERVRECIKLFAGEHNFVRFCKSYDYNRDTLLNLHISVSEGGEFITLIFCSKYFLWNIIRRVVSAIEAVGKGVRSLDDVKNALDGRDINFGIARPDALTLTEVQYKDVKFVSSAGRQYSRHLKEKKIINALDREFFSRL
ncbi:MAG: tRNA pseudouridine(38-40) synthase TruA [archaeon]|nr:tRNA pseudouridine(38-40) synthase TruA [archaeon]